MRRKKVGYSREKMRRAGQEKGGGASRTYITRLWRRKRTREPTCGRRGRREELSHVMHSTTEAGKGREKRRERTRDQRRWEGLNASGTDRKERYARLSIYTSVTLASYLSWLKRTVGRTQESEEEEGEKIGRRRWKLKNITAVLPSLNQAPETHSSGGSRC